ncbi:DUF2029 domain-containing protein [Pseudonocardiaceae bacterium YIM PH 21723]|nr:DUF2029 domain-containing protein [Pseudonocardiaceae bacterium YIM PH 21723]
MTATVSGERTEQTPARPTVTGFLIRYSWLILILVLAPYLVLWRIWPFALSLMIDVQVYQAGGHFVINGLDLYRQNVVNGGLYFTYTPFAALLFTLLTPLPVGVLKVLVMVGNLAGIGFAAYLSLRSLGTPRGRDLTLLSVALLGPLFWLEPARSTVWLGQINLLLLVLLLWDLIRRDGQRWQGVLVGVAAGIKLTPAIFIGYLLLTGRFRAAGNALLGLVATIGIGFLLLPKDSLAYWGGTFVAADRVGSITDPRNQSLAGAVARAVGWAPEQRFGWLLGAVLLGAVGLGLAVLAHRRGHHLLGLVLCGLTSTVVAPFSWHHHWVWFVPLACLLFAGRRWWLLGGLYLLVFPWVIRWPMSDGSIGKFGWYSLPPFHGLELLYQNVYLVVFLIVVGYTLSVLGRSTKERTPAHARPVE